MVIIGIDPGLTGAIAKIDHHGLREIADMPTMKVGTGKVKNQVNGAALSSLLKMWLGEYDKNEIMVLIELVHAMPKQGVGSVFSLGHTLGIIEGVVAARGYPSQSVTPGSWKKHFSLTADKDQCRTVAQKFYPDAPLTRKMDHNRAEAILIARYGYQKHA